MNVSSNNNTFPPLAPDERKQHINFNIFSHTFSRLSLTALLALAANTATAQVNSNNYALKFGDTNTNSLSVQTKAGMWYDYSAFTGNKASGDNGVTTITDEVQVQTAHTYEQTIYCHEGESIYLGLPCALVDDNDASVLNDWDYKDYYRWFNWRTGGNFLCQNLTTQKIYYKDYDSNSDIYVYLLNTSSNTALTAEWPGDACTYEKTVWDGSAGKNYNLYSWTCENSPDLEGVQVQFNNGSSTFCLASYENGDTYYYGSTGSSINAVIDLLTDSGWEGQCHRFANGYVGGLNLDDGNSSSFGVARFYYPTSNDFTTFSENNSNLNPDNSRYDVACDYSNYNDFGSPTNTPGYAEEIDPEDCPKTITISNSDFSGSVTNNVPDGWTVDGDWEPGSGIKIDNDFKTDGTSYSNSYYVNNNGGVGTNFVPICKTLSTLHAGTYTLSAAIFANETTTGNIALYVADANGTVMASQAVNTDNVSDVTPTSVTFTLATTQDVIIGIRTINSIDSYFYFIADNFVLTMNSWQQSYTAPTYDTFAADNFKEPTLIGRVLYHIIAVDNDESSDYATKLKSTDYQGGDETGKKFLEEYNITFPARHAAFSDEVVGLSMDARAYAIPGLNKTQDSDKSVTVSISGGWEVSESSNGTFSSSCTISGCERAISFRPSSSNVTTGSNYEHKWQVNDGTQVTITVTKYVSSNSTTYNIAKFTLTFKDAHAPLTDAQVAKLDDIYGDVNASDATINAAKADYKSTWWVDLSYRSPKYLKHNYKVLAMLNFDEYKNSNSQAVFGGDNIAASFSAFPIEWDYTGYGFNNGTMAARDGQGGSDAYTGGNETHERVNAGQYAVMDAYNGWDDETSWYSGSYNYWDVNYDYRYLNGDGTAPVIPYAKDSSGAWFYVDGTQTPGTICTLPLNDTFCKGTTLYVTAWMKGANAFGSTGGTKIKSFAGARDDSSIIMTIRGVTQDGDEVEIGSFSSGQIRRTDAISTYSDDGIDPNGKNWGKGTENQWMQVAFEFAIGSNSGDDGIDYGDFVSYTLQLTNYCASSDGSDFYFDDLCVFVAHPDYTVDQIIQSSGENEGLYRADFDYNALMIYEGDTDEHTTVDGKYAMLDFIIINENIYRDYLVNAGKYPPVTGEEGDVLNAIDASVITLKDDGTNSYEKKYAEAAFYYYWYSNELYDNDINNIKNTGGATEYANMIAETYGSVETAGDSSDKKKVWLYRHTNAEGKDVLSVDFIARINPYVPYRIVAIVDAGKEDSQSAENYLNELRTAMADALISSTCAMSEEFYFKSTTELKLNGAFFDPTETYCENQTNNFSVHQTYLTIGTTTETEYVDRVDSSTGLVVKDGDGNIQQDTKTINVDDSERTEMVSYSYCDWFYGTEDEYLANDKVTREDVKGPSVSGSYGDYTPQTALYRFRNGDKNGDDSYPDSPDLADAKKKGDDSENWYKLIEDYVMAGKIVLYEQTLNVYANSGDTYLVIQPIIHDGHPVADTNNNYPDNYEVNYAYIAIEMRTDEATDGYTSPELQPGFANITYPDNDHYWHLVPNIRLGVQQVFDATENTAEGMEEPTGGGEYITVNLQQPEDEELILLDSSTPYSSNLYLVGTTDETYHTKEFLDKDDFSVLDLPVGTISSIALSKFSTDYDANNVKIQFSKDFTVTEGNCYVLSAYFGKSDIDYTPTEEESSEASDDYEWYTNEENEELICPGLMQLELKVVPEYLVWEGDMEDNWNRDGAWNITSPDNTAITGATVGGRGYVPMLFSEVVIPRTGRAEIYMAGFDEDDDDTGDAKKGSFSDVKRKVDSASATKYKWYEPSEADGMGTSGKIIINPQVNIMYDLPVYDNLVTRPYRANLCKDIHFEPDAQLLHSELLLYRNKVWTDVEVPTQEWKLVSTPLKDVYAGDWYTPSTGTETAIYFKDITFGEGNDRKNPLVFQRAWGKSGSIVYKTTVSSSNDYYSVPDYAATGWSSVYNDTSVPYSPGEGFSIKSYLYDGSDVSDKENLLFRFPKADETDEYDESTYDYAVNTFSKDNSGKLQVTDMVSRTESGTDALKYTVIPFTSSLSSDNNYVIVGNPFTASMSLAKFASANTSLNGCNYWANTPNGPIAGSVSADGILSSLGDGSDVLIDPYSAFFLEKPSGSGAKGTRTETIDEGNGISLTFNDTMQTWDLTKTSDSAAGSGTENGEGNNGQEDNEGGEENDTDSKLVAFSIRAKNGQGASSAAFAYFDDATDEYDASEDAVLLSDITWHSDSIPMVYTVAGDMAASVNRLHSLNVVPIGVFVADSCAYTLTFVGTYNLASPVLYDALNDTETEITEGMTLSLKGASHGRYFIKTTGIEEHGIEEAASEYSITAYSPADRTIVVSSNAEIESVEIYSIGGTLEKKVSGNGSIACTIDGVDSGIAVVRARTSEGTFTRKIIVR